MSKPPATVTRRKYLKYLSAGVVALGAAALGAYEYSQYSRKQALTPTSVTATTATSTVGPVVRYALEKGIAPTVAQKLAILTNLDENSRSLVEYLCSVTELVESNESDKHAKIESLQTKVLEGSQQFSGILTDAAVSQEEADALRYLASFPREIQVSYIDFGLNDAVTSYLSILPLLPSDFARWAADTKFLIQNHKITQAKIDCLKDPGGHAADILASFLSDARSIETFADLAEELRIPEVRAAQKKTDLKITEAVEDIVYSTLLSQDPLVTKNLQQILGEGIPDRREYCTPLQALAWYYIDHEPEERNPLNDPGFDVNDFVPRVWSDSSTSRHFMSEEWRSFDQVVDRLNSPSLLYTYMHSMIRYHHWDPSMRDWLFYSPQDVFNRNEGDCIPQASFATFCLRKSGWKAINLFLSYTNTWDHAVCVFRDKSGSLCYLDNAFQPRRGIFGPFDSIRILAKEVDRSLKSLGGHPSDSYELCTYGENYHCSWRGFLESLRPVSEDML